MHVLERIIKMTKKILIIKGSPRRLSNSNQLADAFGKGAEDKGHKVFYFDATKEYIDSCKACDLCWSKGQPCAFKNANYERLTPLVEEADIVVFSTPLYWGSFSAQLKSLIDRLYAYTVPQTLVSLEGKKSVLLAVGASEEAYFNGLIQQFKDINYYLDWQAITTLIAPNTHKADQIHETNSLSKAFELGKTI